MQSCYAKLLQTALNCTGVAAPTYGDGGTGAGPGELPLTSNCREPVRQPGQARIHAQARPGGPASARAARQYNVHVRRAPPNADLAVEQLSIVVRESFRAILRMPSQLQKQLTSADGWRSGSFQTPSSFWKFPFS